MPSKKRPPTKKTLIAPSDKPSAVSRRTKNQLYAQVGIKEQKVFLGKDALDKLRFLLHFQYSHEDDVNDRDPLLLGDVLSYCINACYNLKSFKAERTSDAPKTMTAAKTPQGQRLYRYHQMAKPTMPPNCRNPSTLAISEVNPIFLTQKMSLRTLIGAMNLTKCRMLKSQRKVTMRIKMNG